MSSKQERRDIPRLLDPESLYEKRSEHKNLDKRKSASNTRTRSDTESDINKVDKLIYVKERETEEFMTKPRHLAPNTSDTVAPREKSRFPNLRVIGMLFDTYVLCEDSVERELLMVDQHAAHERIMYEKLKRELSEDGVVIQESISLEPLELSISELESLKENEGLLKGLGFLMEDFGQNTVALRGVPMLFGKPNNIDLFRDILDNLESGVSESYELRLEKVMKLACTSAVKAGDRIGVDGVGKLIEELATCENPFTCPHGRPTIVKMKKSEIEKKFKRI